MKDTRIRYNPAEREAVQEQQVHCFCLASQSLSATGMASRFLDNLDAITGAVENLFELLAAGMTVEEVIEEVIEDHPDLERDDLLAALEFGALASRQGRVAPLGAG